MQIQGQLQITAILARYRYDLPQASSIIQFNVKPKINLYPGKVLPVALGTPIILTCILFLLAHKRRVES